LFPSDACTPEIVRPRGKAVAKSFGVLGTCMLEAPEFANRQRKVVNSEP
jgi:hypothetical protein